MSDERIVVLYHGGCTGGIGAALAAFLRFGDRAKYVPVFQSEPFPDLGDLFGKTVYCMDYCPDPTNLIGLIHGANAVILLDHHDGVHERTEELFRNRKLRGNVDVNRSGAVMAWNLFFPRLAPPALLRHIEDRDLQLWKMPDTREVMAVVDQCPEDMHAWQQLMHRIDQDAAGIIQDGASILRRNTKLTVS